MSTSKTDTSEEDEPSDVPNESSVDQFKYIARNKASDIPNESSDESFDIVWTQLLLNWLNKCAHPKMSVKKLHMRCMLEALNTYKKDICEVVPETNLAVEDLEPLLKYNYELLRLSNLKPTEKKLRIMTSVLLFHCCISSLEGAVDSDICKNLTKNEQEMILKFCERLAESGVSNSNVEKAIEYACKFKESKKKSPKHRTPSYESGEQTDEVEHTDTTDQTDAEKSASSEHVETIDEGKPLSDAGSKLRNIRFDSSVTVLPSLHKNFTSSYSETSRERSVNFDLDNITKPKPHSKSADSSRAKLKIKSDESKSKSELEDAKLLRSKSDVSKLVMQCDSDDSTSYKIRSKSDVLKSRAKSDEATSKLESDGRKTKGRSESDGKKSKVRSESDGKKSKGRSEKSGKSKHDMVVHPSKTSKSDYPCKKGCNCDLCAKSAKTCGAPGGTTLRCLISKGSKELQNTLVAHVLEPYRTMVTKLTKEQKENVESSFVRRRGKAGAIMALTLLVLIGLIIVYVIFKPWKSSSGGGPGVPPKLDLRKLPEINLRRGFSKKDSRTTLHLNESFQDSYLCINHLCQRSFGIKHTQMYKSLSRCTLLCMGPQLWPKPIGFTHYSNKIVALATSKLEYRFQSVPSELVQAHLAQALKLFISDLARLEKSDSPTKTGDKDSIDLFTRKMNILLDVEHDSDPRIRMNTDETYNLKIDVINNVVTINIISPSFCGVRHGLETLSQLILLDQYTGFLITLSNTVIRDSPTYKYRGIMLDTARNFIPVSDLMRTIDAMATCKLNTFHWRISDATSFPLLLPILPQLSEYGAYDRTMIYTKDDVRALVKRASIRGIRVILEVAAPGPVGRAWSWTSDASCPTRSENLTCENSLCIRLSMTTSVMDILQAIYTEILELTQVDDVFHLSDGLFSITSCHYLLEERQGFLKLALDRLKAANRGTLPKLPIIWYTEHLDNSFEALPWEKLGIQLMNWTPNPSNPYLSKYRVIQSTRWDLSCEIRKQRCVRYRTWQSMYSWWEWRTVNAFAIEGGETVLWTDIVDSTNLDSHVWPRAAAVAERLWSDVAINDTVSPSVYMRLDCHRTRMLQKSVMVPTIWPAYCSHSPEKCVRQIKVKNN